MCEFVGCANKCAPTKSEFFLAFTALFDLAICRYIPKRAFNHAPILATA